MEVIKQKFNRFKKIIFIILLAFLVLSFNLVNIDLAKASTEMERYIDSSDRIIEIVSNSIITLPKLNMLGSGVIANLVFKVNKYSSFVNDYTQDIETEGEALFGDLMEGYRSTRKLVFLAKSINNLSSAQQTAYELINTVDNYLDEESSTIYNYNTFKNSLQEQKNLLDNNFNALEILISNVISNVNIERDSYANDISNLFSLRAQLKESADVYLGVSNEIISISEDIIKNETNNFSSDHGSDHGM
jgi:hypothetical protein